MSDPIAQYGALFQREGEAFVATPLARGPWDPNALHGGPVAALLAHVVERHDPGDANFVARITVELMRPVPLGRLHVAARTIRPGRRVQWIDAALLDDDGREVALAHALRLQAEPGSFAVGPSAEPPLPAMARPETVDPMPLGMPGSVGFWLANDLRLVAGDWQQAGPATAWFHLLVPVVAGDAVTALQRVCAAADFGSGVGNPVRTANLATINAEITVHVHRDAEGEWIGLDSRAWAHDHGTGMCETLIVDERGPVGRAVQALLVQRFMPFASQQPEATTGPEERNQ